MISIAAFPALAASGAYAAWMDAGYRRLPNQMVVIVGALGLAANFWTGGTAQLGSSIGHAAIALAAGFALFALRVIGAGDAKYYAAVAAWFPVPYALQLLGWVSATGAILAAGFLLSRWFGRNDIKNDKSNSKHAQVPFGVAIALGGMLTSYGLAL